MSGAPIWSEDPSRQEALYEALGYPRYTTTVDGDPWERPADLQRFLFNWDDRVHAAICPARAGKSYSAAKKALPLVLGRRWREDGLGPVPTRGWVVGPTYDLAQKEFRYLWQDLVETGPQKLGWPKPPLSRMSMKAGDMYILTAWGSEVIGKSADKPQSLLGEALDWVILSESAQLSGEIWTRHLEPRLSTTQGYAFLPSTPDGGALWLYDLSLQGGQHGNASYRWGVEGNPTYPKSEIELAKAKYGEDHPVFREQYLGEWTFYSGTVFGNDFSLERNIIEPFEIPPEWPRVRAIDFGYRDPFVCLWAAIAPDGRLIIYREWYQRQRAMAEHATAILAASVNERILYTVGDPSAQQAIADLRLLGVPCLDANRDRQAGRMAVGDALRAGRLQVFETCREWLREVRFYRWAPDRDRENNKELTLGDDHAMDATRYLVMSRPQPVIEIPKPLPNTFEAAVNERRHERLMRMSPLWRIGRG